MGWGRVGWPGAELKPRVGGRKAARAFKVAGGASWWAGVGWGGMWVGCDGGGVGWGGVGWGAK